MLPLGFTNLADSPTIVLSPHQHQFDPISSRAAHTYCYRPIKPVMPSRPWDRVSPKTILCTATHSKKRSREETSLDDDVLLDQRFSPARTPAISPDNVHGADIRTRDPMTGYENAVDNRPGSLMQEELVDENKLVVEQKLEEGLRSLKESPEQADAGSATKRPRQGPSIESVKTGTTRPPGTSPRALANSNNMRNFAQLIGVGWTAIENDPDTLSAWRGIAKGVEKSHSISGASVEAKNGNLDACLIKANEGWYLVKIGMNNCHRLGATENEAFTNMPLSITQLHADSPPFGQLADSPPINQQPSEWTVAPTAPVLQQSPHENAVDGSGSAQVIEDTPHLMDVD